MPTEVTPEVSIFDRFAGAAAAFIAKPGSSRCACC
jgi:hypothetical protein